jgi:putative endonuclease
LLSLWGLAVTRSGDLVVNKQYYIYIMTNQHGTVLYTGITNDLRRRVYEHREGRGGRFTSRYNVSKLVYYEVAEDVRAAIAREKQIKGGPRRKKIDLVNGMNPEWKDLYDEL